MLWTKHSRCARHEAIPILGYCDSVGDFCDSGKSCGGRAGEIVRAAALIDQGEWQTSIAVLEPLLRLNRDELSPTEAGIAWNLLGTAYQSVGEYQKARRSFEAALRLLQNSSAPVGQQAAALDNFASLQLE